MNELLAMIYISATIGCYSHLFSSLQWKRYRLYLLYLPATSWWSYIEVIEWLLFSGGGARNSRIARETVGGGSVQRLEGRRHHRGQLRSQGCWSYSVVFNGLSCLWSFDLTLNSYIRVKHGHAQWKTDHWALMGHWCMPHTHRLFLWYAKIVAVPSI